MKIELASATTVADLWSEVEPQVLAADSLEEAAQALAGGLFDQFEESVVLARVFVTAPFDKLPPANQQIVRRLIDSAGAVADLRQTTPVLSLIGTYGREQDWRDRRRSKDHVGIPLVSSSFISAIPMISRLLKEFGVPVDWVDSHDSEMIVDTIGREAGVFYVENAATAIDSQGRNIIMARDFVADHGIKSVFGVGGAYSTGQIAVIVVFCRDQIPRAIAERFVTLAAFFITKTTPQVERGRVFSD